MCNQSQDELILFCFTGKTILASLLIAEARKLPDIKAVFFYCRNNDTRRNSFIAVARSLLLQLLHLDESIPSYLFDEASSSGDTTLSSPVIAKDLLEVSIKFFNKVYIIVDGIDECEKKHKKSSYQP
jgi:hypothetical protein